MSIIAKFSKNSAKFSDRLARRGERPAGASVLCLPYGTLATLRKIDCLTGNRILFGSRFWSFCHFIQSSHQLT